MTGRSALYERWFAVVASEALEMVEAVPKEIAAPRDVDYTGSACIAGWLDGMAFALWYPEAAGDLLNEAADPGGGAAVERAEVYKAIVAWAPRP